MRYNGGGGAVSPSLKKRNENDLIIALAGNPNVGKSTVFNGLTGLHQHTGNWTGKTVASAQGYFRGDKRGYVLVDIPGTYSLTPHSAEEEIARDFLCSDIPDAVVCVCDATNLRRNLPLVLQIKEITERIVLCINLLDEAKKKGIDINLRALSRELDLPVVGCVARSGKGLRLISDAIESVMKRPEKKAAPDNTSPSLLYSEAERIISRCIIGKASAYTKRERALDRILTGKLFGFPIMLLGLMFIFWLTIEGANIPSDFLASAFASFEAPMFDFLIALRLPQAVCEALVFGIWRVLSKVIAVMLPPMAVFFPLFTLLEDLGYLPRIAFNLDRAFKCCGACGKQGLTMCMGFGCNAVGATGCRIIDSPRERLIAMLTNSFVPCNGRFPAIISLSAIFFVGAGRGFLASVTSAAVLTFAVLFGILSTFVASKLLSITLLRGIPSSFSLEIPPYRAPQVGKVIIRSILDRTLFVLGRAVSVAAPAGLIIWLLSNITVGELSLLSRFSSYLDPFARLMGLDGTILAAFILGFPANEIVLPLVIMAYTSNGALGALSGASDLSAILSANGWTSATAICFILFSLMHWPCSTTLMTIKKESGSLKWTLVAFLLPTLFGILTCIAVNFIFGLVM